MTHSLGTSLGKTISPSPSHTDSSSRDTLIARWGNEDANREQSQREIQEATKRIFSECIPALVKELEDLNIDQLFGFYFHPKYVFRSPFPADEKRR